MSCGVAATERKRAHSSRFHQRADRLLVRSTRAHHWLASSRDRSCHRSPAPGGPRDEGVDGQRHRQTRQGPHHLGRGRLSHRPAMHHSFQLAPARLQPGACDAREPAIQNDEDDQRNEQDSLRDRTTQRNCRLVTGPPSA